MKVSCFYLMLGLSAIVAQTTILKLPLFQGAISDLLIPFIVFLSLHRPNRQGISVAVILGFVMDLVSGGIFGLYLSVYFWVFLSARSLAKFFDVGETMFQSILIGLYVLGQNLVFCASVPMPGHGTQLLVSRATTIASQIIFGALTGPAILMFLRRLDARLERRAVARREAGELGGR
jgi:rod shape-determining protein MreD